MNICTINDSAIAPPWASPEEVAQEIVGEILSGGAYTASLLFGLPINSYVLWLIVRGRQERIASDFITLNQIMVEILLCLSGILYFPTIYLSPSVVLQPFMFLSSLFFIMRSQVHSYICLEQYLATVHPVMFLRCKPLRYKVACCCVSWLIAITFAFVGTTFHFQNEFFIALSALCLLFLLLMTFCGLSVLRVLKRPAPGDGQREHRANSMKERAVKIIFINLVSTFVSQLPMALVASLVGIIPDSLFVTISSVNMCMFVITGFVPPILYLYRVGKLYSKCSCL